MAERDLTSGPDGGNGGPAGDEWDTAFSRLLEGIKLDELSVPTASNAGRSKLTFETVREHVAELLREKLRGERLRREAIERLQQQFAICSATVQQALQDFVGSLLDAFHGGGEGLQLPDPRDGHSRSWQVLGYRSPSQADRREAVISITLTMRGVDALDRGQLALECRVSTPRNPRLVDFTAGTAFRADLEDAICRAYEDVLGTLRFDPAPDTGIHQ